MLDNNYYKNLCWNMTSSDNYILVNKTIAKILMDFDAAILLATLQFKHRILSEDDNGWFWFTRSDIEDNSFLSQYKQVKAEKILIKHQLLSIELREVKHKFAEYKVKIPFFKINYKQVIKFLSVEQKFLDTNKNLMDINNYNINNNIKKEISSKEDIIVSKETICTSDEVQNNCLINRRKRSLLKKPLIENKKKPVISFIPTQDALQIYSYWEGRGLHIYSKDKEGYLKDLKIIKELLQGKVFNDTEYSEYKNHKFTDKEIHLSISRFALMALSSDYEPRLKKKLPKMIIKDFIFNGYWKLNGMYGRSMFIYCLENKAELLKEKDITVIDKYPEVTKAIKKKYAEKILGIDNFNFSNQAENDFRKAAVYAYEFFLKNKSRMIGSYAELKPYKIAECLMEALTSTNPVMTAVQPRWLYNSIIQEKLPAYLYSTAIMQEKKEGAQGQAYYNFGVPIE
jgi:hypothetical protein